MTASIVVDGVTEQDVWSFMHPAENAPLMQPMTVRAFTEPGTGPGVGERQTSVYRCAAPCGRHEVPVTVEIVEMDAGHVVYVSDSAPAVRSHITVASVGGSVRITWTESVAAKVDEAALRSSLEAVLTRIAQHVATRSRPADDAG